MAGIRYESVLMCDRIAAGTPGAHPGIRAERGSATPRACLLGPTGREPFDDAQLESLAALDTEPLGPDLMQRPAQEVLSLEWHGYYLE